MSTQLPRRRPLRPPTVTGGVLVVALALVACDGGSGPLRADGGGGVDGRTLYELPLPGGNSFACATCHALSEPAADGFRRPGHPIGDAASRPSYKNGQLTTLRDAVNTCVVEWMAGEPLAADDPIWQRLEGFLAEQAGGGPAEPLAFSIVAPPADPSGGDAAAGEALFDRSCAICHGARAVGTDRAPSLVGADLEAGYVAERVRRSGDPESSVYEGLTDGRMPFWSEGRLSDDELRDLVAFAVSVGAEAPPDAGPGDPDAGVPLDDAGPSGCASTHPRVGQVATLSTRFHGVMGTARVVDDCTIVIEGFFYDGRGIDVRIYGGLGGDYARGFGIGPDLVRSTPYENETLTLTLPPDRTLDELDGVSVWCVDAAVDFGSGSF